MGYVIRGRTNHKSAPTLHFSLWLSHSPLMCSPLELIVMFGPFHAPPTNVEGADSITLVRPYVRTSIRG